MSLGRELKALREKNGLTIEELSEQTHIGSHILEDLEAGDFGRIRAAIYGSGFVKILAKHYGIDGTPLREAFATEYQAWVMANAKAPAPKKAPLKFTDRRIGAKPAETSPAQRPSTKPAEAVPAQRHGGKPAEAAPVLRHGGKPAEAAPVLRHGDATPVLRHGGNAGDVMPAPAPAPAPAPTPTPRPASTPAPAAPNLMAAPSGPPPAAAAAQPDPLDNPVEEPLGGLFAGIEEAATASTPVLRPAEAAPVLRPGGNAGEKPAPAPAPTPAPMPAPRKQRPPRKPRKPLIDKAALLASARTSIGSLCASVAGVIRTPLFQRIGVAALAIALSAWLCSLFIGGGTAPVLRPGGNAGDIGAEAPRPEEAAPATPVPLPEEAAPAAQVLLPGGNAGAVGAEAPLSDSAVRRQPVHNITGGALTDNLLPPPDCYAD